MTNIIALLTKERQKHDLFQTPNTNYLKTDYVHFTSVKLIKKPESVKKKLKTSTI